MKLTEGVAHTGTIGLILQEPIYLGVHYLVAPSLQNFLIQTGVSAGTNKKTATLL